MKATITRLLDDTWRLAIEETTATYIHRQTWTFKSYDLLELKLKSVLTKENLTL